MRLLAKNFIKSVSPPFLLDCAKKMNLFTSHSRPIEEYGFIGNYSNFDEALAAAKLNYDSNYQSDSIFDYTVKNTNLAKTNFEAKTTFIDTKSLRLLSAFLGSLNHGNNSLDVLDFGGAMGAHYFRIRQYLPIEKIRWTVVDLPKTVQTASPLYCNNELLFSDKITSRCDLILASSAIQYTRDPFKTMVDLTQTEAKHLIIDRLPLLNNHSPIIAVQKVSPSVYSAQYPIHLQSFQIFIENVKKLGWTITYFWDLPEEVISYNSKPLNQYGFYLTRI